MTVAPVVSDRPALLRAPFGVLDGREVERFTLEAGGLAASVLTYGATLQALVAPDREGARASVVLGLATLEEYVERSAQQLGAVVGRYANRIAGATFELDGVRHELEANDGPNCLHGGDRGFDRRVWHVAAASRTQAGVSLTLRCASPHGDGGFPGALVLDATYTLTPAALRLDFRAASDRPTVLNPTSHVYWQLAGDGAGSVESHVLTVRASRYLPVDEASIPAGPPQSVDGTPFDFREPARVGARLRDARLAAAQGYDHYLVLDRDGPGLTPALRLDEPASGRRLEIATTEPGVQLYSGNHLDGSFAGVGGRLYRQGDGLALETQHAPDAPNRPDLPSTVLRPGRIFASTTVHRLSLLEDR